MIDWNDVAWDMAIGAGLTAAMIGIIVAGIGL